MVKLLGTHDKAAGRRALAPSTIQVLHAVVSSIFRAAVRDRKIMANPCEGTRLPKSEERRIVPLTTAPVDTLRNNLPDELKAIVTFTAGTGMRQGEVFGLTRDRLRLLGTNPVVVVDRQLLARIRGGMEFGPLKTRASYRTIPLPAVVVDAMNEHLAHHDVSDDGRRPRIHRRAVDDYIELGRPTWPIDERFYFQLNRRIETDWTLLKDLPDQGLDARVALAAHDQGSLLAWTFGYENNSTGKPVVGDSTVAWDGSDVARLIDLSVGDNVPATVAMELVRSATHAAAEAGARVVVASDIDLATWHPDLPMITGFRAGHDGMSVDTDFLAEDTELADGLLQTALADPGRWGDDRDRSGRYLPNSRTGRLLHRLRYGSSGKPPRMYVG